MSFDMDFVDVREFVSLVCEASGTSSDLAMKLVKAINRKLPYLMGTLSNVNQP